MFTKDAATKWLIHHGDILDFPADALICSANVQLNLSGGVGGAILARYGDRMQRELKNYLADARILHVPPGTVVRTSPCGTPFYFVLHAVAVDAFYQTSHAQIISVLRHSLQICMENHAETVAMTALGTGYGRFSMSDFADVMRELSAEDFRQVREVTVVLQDKFKYEELVNGFSSV